MDNENEMKFTYKAYEKMILLLKEHKYTFCGYSDYREYDRNVIMRHDVDNDLEKALKLAEMEFDLGISSTYFVLTTSNFYNICSRKNKEILKAICSKGHQIGLHFDEAQYVNKDEKWQEEAIEKEILLLEQCVERKVACVSMHRPSKDMLQANWHIKGGRVVNSYDKEFFENYKYISDSRRSWKENVLELIEKEKYGRLHILVHPFWYDETEKSGKEILRSFCREQVYKCYDELNENIRNLNELLEKREIPVIGGADEEDNS